MILQQNQPQTRSAAGADGQRRLLARYSTFLGASRAILTDKVFKVVSISNVPSAKATYAGYFTWRVTLEVQQEESILRTTTR